MPLSPRNAPSPEPDPEPFQYGLQPAVYLPSGAEADHGTDRVERHLILESKGQQQAVGWIQLPHDGIERRASLLAEEIGIGGGRASVAHPIPVHLTRHQVHQVAPRQVIHRRGS